MDDTRCENKAQQAAVRDRKPPSPPTVAHVWAFLYSSLPGLERLLPHKQGRNKLLRVA